MSRVDLERDWRKSSQVKSKDKRQNGLAHRNENGGPLCSGVLHYHHHHHHHSRRQPSIICCNVRSSVLDHQQAEHQHQHCQNLISDSWTFIIIIITIFFISSRPVQQSLLLFHHIISNHIITTPHRLFLSFHLHLSISIPPINLA